MENQYNLDTETAYPALISLFRGLALFIGFRLTQKLDEKYKSPSASDNEPLEE